MVLDAAVEDEMPFADLADVDRGGEVEFVEI